MLNVVMLNVEINPFMLSVVILSVVAPWKPAYVVLGPLSFYQKSWQKIGIGTATEIIQVVSEQLN
jgi:hypothetical protein